MTSLVDRRPQNLICSVFASQNSVSICRDVVLTKEVWERTQKYEPFQNTFELILKV